MKCRSLSLSFLIVIFISILLSSCTLEKRKYLKGYYFKKNKKVETTANPNGTSTTTNNNSNQTQSTSNEVYQTPQSISGFGHEAIPAFCLYAGLQDGNCTISLNGEKIFCFNPYFDCFIRGGVGLSDLNNTDIYKKFIFSGGVAGGFPILKIGAEYGYSGFMNGNSGTTFYGGFIRLIPKRKSVYLKFELWKPVTETNPENKRVRASCGLGIAF